jgi:hypothetical protein
MMSPFGGRQVGAPSPKERYSGLHLKRSRHRFQRYLLRKQNVANREIAPRPETPRRQLAARKDQAVVGRQVIRWRAPVWLPMTSNVPEEAHCRFFSVAAVSATRPVRSRQVSSSAAVQR